MNTSKEGNAITALFKASGMSITDFAAKSGLKYATAHDIVSGKTKMENIGAGAFVRIAHALGTTADELLRGDVEATKSALKDDEAALLRYYRVSSSKGKAAILTAAEAIANMV